VIEGYIGVPGAGKTLSMTMRAYKERFYYDEIWSNYSINFVPGYKRSPGIHRRFTKPQEFLEMCMSALYAHDGKKRLLLLDEVHLLFDARLWNKVPQEMLQFLAQPRKASVDLLYTAQHESQVEKRLRIVTNYLWLCKMWGRDMNWFHDRPILFWASCFESFEFRSPRATSYGKKLYRFKKKYGELFDTMEVLDRMDIGEVGTGITQSVVS
jgi:hypothetical protein